MTAVSTRLVRLLNMVPYFQANPKITYAEAASDLGVTVKQLRDDLNQLWMCGLPGYGPGDLIDFEFSGDTIEVTFSAGIDHPLRLTSPEATGILVALRALVDVPGMVDPEAARSAIAKIESAAGMAQPRRRMPVAAVDEPAPVESRRRRSGAGRGAQRPRAGDRVLLGVPRHAVQPGRRPHPGRPGRRPQLPGGVVPVGRGGAAVPVRPHRRCARPRRTVGAAATRGAGGTGHLAVRRRPVVAVGHAAHRAIGVVDVRLLPAAGDPRTARRCLRGGDDVCLRGLDGAVRARLRFGGAGARTRIAGPAGEGIRRRGAERLRVGAQLG